MTTIRSATTSLCFATALTLLATSIDAQQPAPAAPPKAQIVESVPIAPTVRAVMFSKKARIEGLAEAQAVLQREIDAAIADYARGMQKLQSDAPEGMELAPDLSAYRRKATDQALKKKDGSQ